MFDVPLDAWYAWLGLAVASATAVGVAASLPATPPPDAAGVATTVDGVAASPHAAVGSHPLPNADAVRVGRETVSLRGPGGTAHAELGYGPVTPATGDESLAAVLAGEPPDRVFESPAAFRRAIGAARDADPEWHPSDELRVRRVSWEGVDVVLVG
jgi:hypothetical protein